jgi:UDP-3-O-[3-hydroxymyristoyl] glucosamine N-acyltransferase
MLLIKELIEKLGCLDFIGNSNAFISEIVQLSQINNRENVLSWCSDKNIEQLDTLHTGTIVCSSLALKKKLNPQCNYLIVENPRLYFGRLVEMFFYHPPIRRGISKTAVIHPTSIIGKGCYIGDHTVIEENCIIGDYCHVGHNNVLHYGTILKNNVTVGCNNTIGGFGYGYEKNEQGDYEPIPHIGNVVIEDNVEICNNSCIDRAAIGSTFIGKNVKISNLVHIGHGVTIGKNSLIIANAMIAGSAVIGENVWIAPSSSIINKISVGNNAIVGLSAVVIKSVENGAVVAGNPAKKLNVL